MCQRNHFFTLRKKMCQRTKVTKERKKMGKVSLKNNWSKYCYVNALIKGINYNHDNTLI